jgi:hypothetical protein
VPEQENRAVFSGLMDCFCFVGKQSLKEMFFAGTSKKDLAIFFSILSIQKKPLLLSPEINIFSSKTVIISWGTKN